MIKIHSNMKDKYCDTFFGVLALQNFCVQSGGKEAFRRLIHEELDGIRQFNSNYDRKLFCKTNKVVKPYVHYYKKFKKTYHVLPQIESILNGKELPDAIPLVQALFMTEIKTSLLIAGHDLKKCLLPLTIQMSQGGETYLGAGNRSIVLKPSDICLRDQSDYVLSIIYGQDEKTRITEKTTDVLFLIDGVPGLDKKYIEQGLKVLLDYICIFVPNTVPVDMRVISPQACEK